MSDIQPLILFKQDGRIDILANVRSGLSRVVRLLELFRPAGYLEHTCRNCARSRAMNVDGSLKNEASN
jgi:hypothetical protein